MSDADDDTASRARVRSDPAEVTRRIDVCRAEMAGGTWSTRRAEELAEEWGCALRTVQDASRIASRLLYDHADPEQVEALRRETVVELGAIATEARALGEPRTAIAALAERAEVAGLKPRAGTEVVVQVALGDGVQATVAAAELTAFFKRGLAWAPADWRAAFLAACRGEAPPLPAGWRYEALPAGGADGDGGRE